MDCCGCMGSSSGCARSRSCQAREVSHVRPAHQCSPPSTVAPIDRLWTQLPACNRQRLILLLSQVLERQLQQPGSPRKEAGHDRPSAAPA
jgi:hypothetical protein